MARKSKNYAKKLIGKSFGCEINFDIIEKKKLKYSQQDQIQYLEQALLLFQ